MPPAIEFVSSPSPRGGERRAGARRAPPKPQPRVLGRSGRPATASATPVGGGCRSRAARRARPGRAVARQARTSATVASRSCESPRTGRPTPRRAPRARERGRIRERSRAQRGEQRQVGLAVLAHDGSKDISRRSGSASSSAPEVQPGGAELDRARRPRASRSSSATSAGRVEDCSAQSSPSRCARSIARAWNSAARAGRARWRAAGARAGGAASRREAIVRAMSGPSTRAIHAGVPAGEQGDPLLPARCSPRRSTCAGTRTRRSTATGATRTRPGRTSSARSASSTAARARSSPPAWRRSRRCCSRCWSAGDVLVACGDGYPGIRGLARERLEPLGVEVRLVRHAGDRLRRRRRGARVARDALQPAAGPGRHRRRRGGRARRRRAARGRQHGLHPARPAAARPRRRLRDALGHQEPVRALRPAARSGLRARPGARARRCGAGARSRARSPAASRPGSPTARWPRSACGWSARAPTRRGRRAAARRDDVVEVVHPADRDRGAQMAFAGPLVGFDARDRRARPGVPRRVRGWSPRPRASAASTRPRSAAAAGGPTTSPRGSSASPRGARTRDDLVGDVERALDAPLGD